MYIALAPTQVTGYGINQEHYVYKLDTMHQVMLVFIWEVHIIQQLCIHPTEATLIAWAQEYGTMLQAIIQILFQEDMDWNK